MRLIPRQIKNMDAYPHPCESAIFIAPFIILDTVDCSTLSLLAIPDWLSPLSHDLAASRIVGRIPRDRVESRNLRSLSFRMASALPEDPSRAGEVSVWLPMNWSTEHSESAARESRLAARASTSSLPGEVGRAASNARISPAWTLFLNLASVASFWARCSCSHVTHSDSQGHSDSWRGGEPYMTARLSGSHGLSAVNCETFPAHSSQ